MQVASGIARFLGQLGWRPRLPGWTDKQILRNIKTVEMVSDPELVFLAYVRMTRVNVVAMIALSVKTAAISNKKTITDSAAYHCEELVLSNEISKSFQVHFRLTLHPPALLTVQINYVHFNFYLVRTNLIHAWLP